MDQENKSILGGCLKSEQVSAWEVGVVGKQTFFPLLSCAYLTVLLAHVSEGTGPGGMTYLIQETKRAKK